MPVMDGEVRVKVLLVEDLIGLKLQALANDPKNRYAVDAPDIQRLLKMHRSRLDVALVREYFRLFGKEELLDEWLGDID
jgi:predicted nucleotidyltransferase